MAQIELNVETLAKLRRLRPDLKTNRSLAEAMDVNEGNLSRLLAGKSGIGGVMIAGLVKVFGPEWLPDLLVVVDENDDTAA